MVAASVPRLPASVSAQRSRSNSPVGPGNGCPRARLPRCRVSASRSVDDDKDAVEMFGMLLEARGAAVTATVSARDALELVARDPFDAVVSDVAMPGMDGYQLLARLREAGLRELPVIALTGFARPDD